MELCYNHRNIVLKQFLSKEIKNLDTKLLAVLVTCLGVAACGGGGDNNSSAPVPPSPPTPPHNPYTPTPVPNTNDKVHIQIAPHSAKVCSYTNAACVTVLICQADNPDNCDSVDDILLDTGSSGLRVFGSLLTKTLASMEINGSAVAECVGFADGTGSWGPVKYANVKLGSAATTEAIPIQVIDVNFPTTGAGKANCIGASTSPSDFSLNGIIGVGPLKTDAATVTYFTCSGTICHAVVPPAYVTNPISKFAPGLNNGLTLTFAALPDEGATGADGYGIFGVATSAANTPKSTVSTFEIKASSPIPINVFSTFHETTLPSFLDTGSQFFYFEDYFLPKCPGTNAFCPDNITAELAQMNGNDGNDIVSSAYINFNIGNAMQLIDSGNTAFSNIGYVFPGFNNIDWGMPFYFGRTVYTVFAGESVVINGVQMPASDRGYWIY